MDLLLIVLIVLAVIALGGWGYGTYAVRPAPAATTEVVAAPGWVSPLGIIGLLAVVALVAMLITGWRPFVVVGPPEPRIASTNPADHGGVCRFIRRVANDVHL